MHRSLQLAVLALLGSGCLGGAAGPPGTHEPRPIVTVPDVVHPAGEPDAIGVSADAAGAVLHRAHLRLAIPRQFRLSSFWGDPLVMHQSPAAGARVPAGTAVTLAVQQDPGTAVCVTGRRAVPEVVGETFADAERSLGEIAFSATLPPLPPSRLSRWEDAYRVTSQSIPPGTRIDPCESVRLQVRLD
jgi:beta-lactam-binding protein with PASTA domain